MDRRLLPSSTQFFFSKNLPTKWTKPIGLISIAADDFAEVNVNGHVIGSIGSISDYSNPSRLKPLRPLSTLHLF